MRGEAQTEAVLSDRKVAETRRFAPSRTIVLVGLMGAGKSKVGRRLAVRLGLPFFDSDPEIEAAAGETIEEIFANRGEHVGGGAFMHPATRELVARRGVSLWLRADLEVLVSRVLRRSNRPLLKQGDARAILTELIERRYPLYAEADVVVDSGEGSPEATVTRAIAALAACPRAMLPPEG